jgi:hypothetical protein
LSKSLLTKETDEKLTTNRAKDRSDRDADQIQQYLEWKARMRAEGWQWDKTKNNFYKTDRQGRQVWNEGGFRLEDRAAVVAQRNV